MSLTTQQSLKHIFSSMHHSYFIFGTQLVHDSIYQLYKQQVSVTFYYEDMAHDI